MADEDPEDRRDRRDLLLALGKIEYDRLQKSANEWAHEHYVPETDDYPVIDYVQVHYEQLTEELASLKDTFSAAHYAVVMRKDTCKKYKRWTYLATVATALPGGGILNELYGWFAFKNDPSQKFWLLAICAALCAFFLKVLPKLLESYLKDEEGYMKSWEKLLREYLSPKIQKEHEASAP